ncbi:hypothetical protein BDW66DRAFT_147152 [Aspergillus desertorum]
MDISPSDVKLPWTRTWFAFDLDDTLHEFRKASANASRSNFIAILEAKICHLDTGTKLTMTMGDLEATYRDTLRSEIANAFTDGRTSDDYRRERFSHLDEAHSIQLVSELLDKLSVVYRSGLRRALTLKAGALQVLETPKARAKKHAQEWTVTALGLERFINILDTTNEVRLSKLDGLFRLFSAVSRKYNIAPGSMVHIGDNEQRDVVPARAEDRYGAIQ